MAVTPIGGQDRLRAAAAAAALRANSASRVSSAPGAPREPDSVELSGAAKSLSAAHKAVADAPDVREERVSALKEAIADGTYTVNSRNLARKLLSS